MRRSFRWFAACVVLGLMAAPAAARPQLSGPLIHDNLAIYLVHGRSAAGPVPLSLEEAMTRGVVQVHETGDVNQLAIENSGDTDVFVQSGDIVKGGKQDRALMVSLVLPAHSGRVSIASFCVEQGRWSMRGREDVQRFSSASAAVPFREMKLAMMAPLPKPPAQPGTPGRANPTSETRQRQNAVWNGVKVAQDRLNGSLGAPVEAMQSSSSLQLALENEKLVAAQEAYVGALRAAAEKAGDVVGYVTLVNGRLNGADIYASNGLFRKMWPKQLKAAAVEAMAKRDDPQAASPATAADVVAFLDAAEQGDRDERTVNGDVRLQTRDSDKAFYSETSRADAWVQRSYLAK